MKGAGIRVVEWNEKTYLAAHAEHTELLARSLADPLFNSWAWLSLWWKHFGQPPEEHRLRVFAAYEGDRLIGLMPLVDGRRSRYSALQLTSAGMLGTFTSQYPGVPTEYQDIVAEAGREAEVLSACLQAFWRLSAADELIIGWCHESSRWRTAFQDGRPDGFWRYFRLVNRMTGYSVDLSRGFEAYLHTLSGSSRRALFNQRTKLLQSADVELRVARDDQERQAMLLRLNELHTIRWGAPAFNGSRLQFHVDLIRHLEPDGAVVLSELLMDGRCVSVLYDLRACQRQYNIHMGFDSTLLKSGSLGLLHLGYAMESAAAQGMRWYDFLGGKGKKVDYKRRIATNSVEFATFQMVRSPLAALLFSMKDTARDLIR